MNEPAMAGGVQRGVGQRAALGPWLELGAVILKLPRDRRAAARVVLERNCEEEHRKRQDHRA